MISEAPIQSVRPRSMSIALLLILSFVMGILGSLATFATLLSDPNLQEQLGIVGQNGNIPVKEERIVLEESSAVIDTAKEVSPAVVSILTTRNVRDFFGNIVQESGGGTGFIVTSDGLIVTNKHVVDDTSADYTVVTSDGKDFTGKVLAKDPVFDLAIVQIEASGLPVVELGNADNLEIGQFVVAIGNALAEFQNTVTVGVVSAKDRQIIAGGPGDAERLEGLIQTDAAINPGNSGGPLVNLTGQVVGVNTAIAGDAVGIGFAIPVNVVKTALASFRENEAIKRPALGVRYLPVTKEVARLQDLPVDHGALIISGSEGEAALVPGGPAEKAGLKEEDIILSVNDEEITEAKSLARLLQQYQVGDTVKLTILRATQTQEVSVTLGELN